MWFRIFGFRVPISLRMPAGQKVLLALKYMCSRIHSLGGTHVIYKEYYLTRFNHQKKRDSCVLGVLRLVILFQGLGTLRHADLSLASCDNLTPPHAESWLAQEFPSLRTLNFKA